MRITILLSLAFLTAAGAAPKLGPKAEFVSHRGAGKNVFVRSMGEDVAATQLVIDYEVGGATGSTYAVELYVEANNTGEKAKLIDRQQVTVAGSGKARGRFDRHTMDRLLRDRPQAGLDHLPNPFPHSGWSYRLVLKRERDDIVSDTGVDWAEYEWPPK